MPNRAATGSPVGSKDGADHNDANNGSDHKAHHTLTKSRSSVVASITDAVTAKDGEPFFICQPDGQVPGQPGHGYGFYHDDCRFLGGYELTLGGHRPETLAATEVDGATLRLELTNPEIDHDGNDPVDRDQLGITWTRRVESDGPALHDEIEIRNFGSDQVTVPIDLKFRARFEDVFEIRGLTGMKRGTLHSPDWQDGTLLFRYDGIDDVERTSQVRIDPAPDARRDDGASLRLQIDGRNRAVLRVDIALSERPTGSARPVEKRNMPQERPKPNIASPGEASAIRADEEGWIGGHGWRTSVRTSSFALRRTLGRSLDDLALLRARLDGLRYYGAGIPWFATLFGRDSLISSLQTLAFDADVAAETLRLLAKRQGTTDDAWRDEAPGRILHELRIGELARADEIPQTPYYGSIDATPLFLMTLAEHARWTGSLDLFRELHEAVEGALGWIDRTADADDNGFLTYSGRGSHGLANQGWKDSGNAIVMADGSLAKPPIALAEVQGYAYRARLQVAELFERDGDGDRASKLRHAAAGLQQRFEDKFWSDDLGCYVMAMGHGAPCKVVSSNTGQVLWTGVARKDRAAKVAERLQEPDMFAGWGIRTLSSDETAYQPIGYHLGTIWPHDNSLIAEGFRRYGHDEPAEHIFLGMLEAASAMPNHRLPECFAGFSRKEFGVPVRYPVACHPQAWASGSIPSLLITTLGIEPDGFDRVLRIRRPQLPQGIEWVELRDLPVGGGSAHLRFVRADDGTRFEVLGTKGGVNVETIAEPAARAVAPGSSPGSSPASGAKAASDGKAFGDGKADK